MTAHENLQRSHDVKGSSDRSFGLVFAVFFLIIALLPMIGSKGPLWWALGLSVGFGVVAMVRPEILAPLNRQWMKLGLLLNKIMSPVLLGIMFFLVITPIGLILRLTGKDPLRLKLDSGASSYWIPREPPGPDPRSMSNQF